MRNRLFAYAKTKAQITEQLISTFVYAIQIVQSLFNLHVSIEGQGHFFTIYFPGFVCFVLN